MGFAVEGGEVVAIGLAGAEELGFPGVEDAFKGHWIKVAEHALEGGFFGGVVAFIPAEVAAQGA